MIRRQLQTRCPNLLLPAFMSCMHIDDGCTKRQCKPSKLCLLLYWPPYKKEDTLWNLGECNMLSLLFILYQNVRANDDSIALISWFLQPRAIDPRDFVHVGILQHPELTACHY